MRELSLMLQDYRLTTAEILYHMPDHPHLLQSFIWQAYDIAPRFPELSKFVSFWEKHLDGPLYSVKVKSAGIIEPSRYAHANAIYTLQ